MKLIILSIILSIASIWDLKTFKIPNALVFCAMAIGFVFSFIEHGFHGFLLSLLSLLIVFLIFIPIWLLRIMGAGDVKLLMGIAAFVGWQETMSITYYAILFAAVVFLFFVGPKRIYQMFKEFFFLIFYKIPLLSGGGSKKIQFSVPIFLAFILITLHVVR